MSASGELTLTSALEQYLPDLRQLKSLSIQMSGICRFPLEAFLDNPLPCLQYLSISGSRLSDLEVITLAKAYKRPILPILICLETAKFSAHEYIKIKLNSPENVIIQCPGETGVSNEEYELASQNL
jgi:hypothetical protein